MKSLAKRMVAAMLTIVLILPLLHLEVQAAKLVQHKINFVTIDNNYLDIPDKQNVVVDLGDSDTNLTAARLEYKNQTTGAVLYIDAVQILGGTLLFTMEYQEEKQKGIYSLEALWYQEDQSQANLSFAAEGIQISYGVAIEQSAQIEADTPDDVLVDKALLDEVTANVVTLDENGNTISETEMADILEGQTNLKRTVAATKASGELVVMLDPGHDSTHRGASYNNYKEESVVLKIAQYCLEELEKYPGVSVYMTRSKESCAFGGTAVSASTCNTRRVDYAKEVNASVFVSFHLNASTSSSANGVGVYYPNSNYHPELGKEGKELAQEIYDKLHALGLAAWAGGTLIRNSEDGTTYPDKSLADYLNVIRNSKLKGITAVLIEHCFMSNVSDAANFLSTDEKLKSLGTADAQAIAAAYKLGDEAAPTVKTPAKTTITAVQSKDSNAITIKWGAVSANGYTLYRSTNAATGFQKIADIPVVVPQSTAPVTYIDTTMSSNKSYFYKVRAYNTSESETAYAPFSTVVAGKALARVVFKTVAAEDGKIRLSWEQSNDAVGYQLQRSTSATAGFTKIASIKPKTKVSYIDVNVMPQTTYYYRLRVFNGSNRIYGYSSFSDVAATVVPPETKLTKVQSNAGGILTLTWQSVAQASGYIIYRSTSKNGTYKRLKTVNAQTLSYDDGTITIEKQYYYKIKTRNRVNGVLGTSKFSVAKAGKAVGAAKITNIISRAGGKLTIFWNKVSNANGYLIQRSTQKKGTYETVQIIGSKDVTSYTDKKLTTGQTYYYKIQTTNIVNKVIGLGSFSNIASAVPLKRVEIKSIRAVSGGRLKLVWNKVNGAAKYQIQRREKNGKFETIATISNATAYLDKNIKTNKMYYYRVRAVKPKMKKTGYGLYSILSNGKSK
jgi:N-acetylmuramoyl-L-alanine amidase/fibronectin type 3 domain-containing protein